MDRVAYKPLSNDADREEEEEEEEKYLSQQQHHDDNDRDDDDDGYFYHHHNHQHWLLSRYCANFLGLKQLRNILYTLAILLTLIFLALLSLRDNSRQQQPLPSPNDDPHGELQSQYRDNSAMAAALHMQPPPETTTTTTATTTTSKQPEQPSPGAASSRAGHNNSEHHLEARPRYDNYMSSIVNIRESNELGTDDLHCSSSVFTSHRRRTEQSNDGRSIIGTNNTSQTSWWASKLRSSNYVTITDYIRANKSFNYNSSLTLTTQATIEFLYHSLELCKRWDGPISLAVYVPGNEFQVAITLIKYMRQCLPVPLSVCIRDKLTWHFVYNRAHGPPLSSLGYPKEYLDKENFALFVEQDQCPKLAGPNAEDLIRQFEQELRKRNGLTPSNYRQQFKLTYPINVLRNTARLAANTKYVLASDIELYPSINLVPSFMNYITRHDVKLEYNYIDRFIFTLPIFEVKPTQSAPKTKNELVDLMRQGEAIFFHKWVCDACQAFPNRLDWLQVDRQTPISSQLQRQDELIIFEVTQRDKEKNSWEPIFIGTNEDPLYDDRLTWEGRRDKMGQMFEMCLQNYHLLVVANAFLVHAPGIKHIDKSDMAKRYNFMRDNNLIYDSTMQRLREQYANSSNIDKC